MAKKQTNFKSLDALEPIAKVINRADEALKNPKKIIIEGAIPEIVGGVGGGAAGGIVAGGLIYGLGKAGLGAAGITSGLKALGLGISMMTGVGVASVIVAAPAVGGYALFNHAKNKKLNQEKDRLYKEALIKHDAIINELNKKDTLSQDRIEYLSSLNILLQAAIEDLKADLEVE